MNNSKNNKEINYKPCPVAPVVSVIVPIYNSALYLEKCLQSLFRQTLDSIEYIFIDDCSTDLSLDILKKTIRSFNDRSDCVRIIEHDLNKGVAVSRSEGVRMATGRWIIHCDSDDILEENAYEKLVSAGETYNADIVGCGFVVFGNEIKEYSAKEPVGVVDFKWAMSAIGGSDKNRLMGSLWNKLIKRELWEDVIIPEGLSYCEDIAVLFQILQKKPRIYYIGDKLYHYRIHPTSLISTKDDRMLKQCDVFIPFLESLKQISDNESKVSINARIVDLLYRLLKSEVLSISEFSSRYKGYASIIRDNKQHNCLELLHLRLSINGIRPMANMIGTLNTIGYRCVKALLK